MTAGKDGPGQGAKAGADFLYRLLTGRAESLGDLGGEGRFGEKVLAQLAKGAKAAGGQDFLDPGGVQSWR